MQAKLLFAFFFLIALTCAFPVDTSDLTDAADQVKAKTQEAIESVDQEASDLKGQVSEAVDEAPSLERVTATPIENTETAPEIECDATEKPCCGCGTKDAPIEKKPSLKDKLSKYCCGRPSDIEA